MQERQRKSTQICACRKLNAMTKRQQALIFKPRYDYAASRKITFLNGKRNCGSTRLVKQTFARKVCRQKKKHNPKAVFLDFSYDCAICENRCAPHCLRFGYKVPPLAKTFSCCRCAKNSNGVKYRADKAKPQNANGAAKTTYLFIFMDIIVSTTNKTPTEMPKIKSIVLAFKGPLPSPFLLYAAC